MAWVVKADIENLITPAQVIRLTDDTNTQPTTASDTIINAAIAYGAAWVMSYLCDRYPAQCTAQTAATVATEAALVHAIDWLYSRGRTAGASPYKVLCDRANALLERIATGQAHVREWHTAPLTLDCIAELNLTNAADAVDLVLDDGSFPSADWRDN